MISVGEARRTILQNVSLLDAEEVPLLQGMGRVIREDVLAPWDIPSADCSAMDGFAFSSASLGGTKLRVGGMLPAGAQSIHAVAEGEAVRIMTGAPIPAGCDTVVPFEEVVEEGDTITLKGKARQGAHIRRKGENVAARDKVIAAGTLLRPPEIGMLASLGKASVRVYRKPEVAILATGDELVPIGSVPGPGATVNSNSYSLASQVMEAGGTPILLGIARDNQDATREMIAKGLTADFLVTTGGVSIGDRDFVKEIITELGGEIKFWKINLKPGKPFAFALYRGKPVFALPGNPVAAMVTFELFVRPAMLKMMGHTRLFRPVVKATLIEPLRNKGDRPLFVLSRVKLQEGRYSVSSTGQQNSANLMTMYEASGLLELKPQTGASPGDEVEVTLYDREFEMREECHVAD